MSHESRIETLILFSIEEYLDSVQYFDRLYNSGKLKGIYAFDKPPSDQGRILDYDNLQIDWKFSQWGLNDEESSKNVFVYDCPRIKWNLFIVHKQEKQSYRKSGSNVGLNFNPIEGTCNCKITIDESTENTIVSSIKFNMSLDDISFNN